MFDYPSNLKVCNSSYIQEYFKRLFVLRSSGVIFLFLIKMSMLKAIEIEITFFIPLGIPRVARWIISFMLHMSVIKTVQVYLIVGTTFGKHSRELEPVLPDKSVHKKIKHQLSQKSFMDF